MKELEYPFDSETILRKKREIKRILLNDLADHCVSKKIAVLGGFTTKAICECIELFLLNQGIKPIFYESEYNKFFEDGVFGNPVLDNFAPDIVYICTSTRNILEYPSMSDTKEQIDGKLEEITKKYLSLWNSIEKKYNCVIIQNNFEYPYYRLLGNKDVSDLHGRVNFVLRINDYVNQYARSHDNFFVCDINYLAASYGLEQWSEPSYWYMYKYAVALPAIPYLAHNVANIVKSICGKNKKAFNLDLDNTIWGGIIGDDGVDNIEVGQETPLSQTYYEFQEYLKLHKQLGVLLTINSKNDEMIGQSGLTRPESVLKLEDFVNSKINWEPKNENLRKTAQELSLLPESFVFVDDNPAEREIIKSSFIGVGIPQIEKPEEYIKVIDKSGFFETTYFSESDLKRESMYHENISRMEFMTSFEDYDTYLNSLEMKAEISYFKPVYLARITQLVNKSNQFNLTTRRYSQNEIENAMNDNSCIAIYGRLSDRFGDNGVVSVVIGHIKNENELHIALWVMSCRVLKRNMESAMMERLILFAKRKGVTKILGYYYPSGKNAMAKDFYLSQGFDKISEDSSGNTTWLLNICNAKDTLQSVISIL